MTTPPKPHIPSQGNQENNPWQGFAQQPHPQNQPPQPYYPQVYQQQPVYPQQPPLQPSYPSYTQGYQPQTQPDQPQTQSSAGMSCKHCHSTNVTISFVQTKGRTSKRGVGLGGHMNNAARRTTAFFTFGTSNLLWKDSQGTEKTRFQHKKIALCQNCGHSWNV